MVRVNCLPWFRMMRFREYKNLFVLWSVSKDAVKRKVYNRVTPSI